MNRRGDTEHCLNELQRSAWATDISVDTRDGHETLTLLLQPPRILCASTGHYPHSPSWEHVQPTTDKVPWSTDSFPGRTHDVPLRLLQNYAGLCCHRLTLHSTPLPRAWVSRKPLISHYLNPLLSGQRTDTRRWPTCRRGDKCKVEPQELCKQRREREISPCSLRSSGLNPHNQLDVPCTCGIPR